MRCRGYRTRGEGHHWAVFDALPDLVDIDVADTAEYFQSCRIKRSTAIYRNSSAVTETEANELCETAQAFDGDVRRWLKRAYPQYA